MDIKVVIGCVYVYASVMAALNQICTWYDCFISIVSVDQTCAAMSFSLALRCATSLQRHAIKESAPKRHINFFRLAQLFHSHDNNSLFGHCFLRSINGVKR